MPKAGQKGNLCTGHGTWPPRPSISGSDNVTIEGKSALRKGDGYAVHCSTVKPYPCHAGSQAKGSSTVFVNNKPLARVGDDVSCGGSLAEGASTVFAGN